MRTLPVAAVLVALAAIVPSAGVAQPNPAASAAPGDTNRLHVVPTPTPVTTASGTQTVATTRGDPSSEGTTIGDGPPRIAAPGSGTGPWGLILGGTALVLALAVGSFAALLANRISDLTETVDALRRSRTATSSESARAPTIPLAPFDPERTVARTLADRQTAAAAADRLRDEREPAMRPIRREPIVAAPLPPVGDRLEALQADVAELIANPGLRSSDYDAAVRQFGEPLGIEIATDAGTARLVEGGGDPKQRLIAVRLAGGSKVAILPSSRFVKEFPMTYKETLEAGVDVKHCYDCRIDGSAALKLLRIASARVDGSGHLYELNPGALAGFVR